MDVLYEYLRNNYEEDTGAAIRPTYTCREDTRDRICVEAKGIIFASNNGMKSTIGAVRTGVALYCDSRSKC